MSTSVGCITPFLVMKNIFSPIGAKQIIPHFLIFLPLASMAAAG
jgi:hypothetical protein